MTLVHSQAVLDLRSFAWATVGRSDIKFLVVTVLELLFTPQEEPKTCLVSKSVNQASSPSKFDIISTTLNYQTVL